MNSVVCGYDASKEYKVKQKSGQKGSPFVALSKKKPAKVKSLWSKVILERKMLQFQMFSNKLGVNYHNALVKTKPWNKLSSEYHKESLDVRSLKLRKDYRNCNK